MWFWLWPFFIENGQLMLLLQQLQEALQHIFCDSNSPPPDTKRRW
jgi:hypothetical protein